MVARHVLNRAPALRASARAFNSLSTAWGYPRSPYGCRKRAERSRALGLSSALSDGWTDASTTIHPSDHRDAMTLYGQGGVVEST